MNGGESHRIKGNNHLLNGEYEEAIIAYSKAINQNPDNALYYRNRALGALKSEKWDQVLADSEKALELEPNSVKAHYYLGRALTQLGRGAEAVDVLTKGYQLSLEQGLDFSKELSVAMFEAKKKRWEEREAKKKKNQSVFKQYLIGLIEADRQRALREASDSQTDDINKQHDLRLKELDELFENQDRQEGGIEEVPQFMYDNISFELMKDPVITPSGITYDRSTIQAHIRKVGHFDPVTREQLNEDQLINNLALKEALDNYLERNGWIENF
jgi:STIP1 family protein 1